MATPKISLRLTRYGEHGWEWEISIPDLDTEQNWRTNEEGEGMWCWQQPYWAYGGEGQEEWVQRVGTGQFWLAEGRSAAYAKLRRHYQKALGGADEGLRTGQ